MRGIARRRLYRRVKVMYPRDLSWIRLKEYIDGGRGPLVIPIGSLEGHGAHLPIDTDTIIASFIADRVAERNG